MGLFGLFDYEDYILNTLVQSNYARNSLIVLLMYTVTGLARFHLSIIICLIVNTGNTQSGTITGLLGRLFDLVFPVIVTVLLALISDTLFRYVETHRPRYEMIVDYFMANYSRQNFFRWKRMFLLGICGYILVAIALVTIDNYFIFLSIMQTIAGFGACDMLEHGLPRKWYNKLMNWWHRPRAVRLNGKRTKNPIFIDDYPDDLDKLNNKLNNLGKEQFEHVFEQSHTKDLLKYTKDKRRDIEGSTMKDKIFIKQPLNSDNKSIYPEILQDLFNEPREKVVVIPAKPPTPPMLKR